MDGLVETVSMESSKNQNETPTFSEDPTLEVWLIDTGIFIVLDDLPEGFQNDFRWMKSMRLRRKLRMYVPRSEIQNLPGIEKAFSMAKRGPEIRDSLKGFHEWYTEQDRLEDRRIELEGDSNATKEAIEDIQDEIATHGQKKANAFGNSLRAINGLTREFPSATEVAIKLVPFQARRVPWPVKKDVGKVLVDKSKR